LLQPWQPFASDSALARFQQGVPAHLSLAEADKGSSNDQAATDIGLCLNVVF
jgi:hypothetical protein